MKLVTYPFSVEHCLELQSKVDLFLVGNDQFATRIPTSFSIDKIKELIDKKINIEVLVNHYFHENDLEKLLIFLKKLDEINVKKIRISDVGIIQLCEENNLPFSITYSSETLFTSYGQVDFWLRNNVKMAVVARELKAKELIKIAKNKKELKLEAMVHGHMLMMQSKRPLLTNYKENFKYDFNTTKKFIFTEEKREMSNIMYEDPWGTTNMFTGYNLCLIKHLSTFNDFDYIRIDNLFHDKDWTTKIVNIYYDVIHHNFDATKAYDILNKSDNIEEGFFGKGLYNATK